MLTMQPQGKSPIVWTERNREIVHTLTLKVRYLSLSQIARHWWADTPTGARKAREALGPLIAAGFIERRDVLAEPELALREPVFVWRPGELAPSFGAISYRLQSRWERAARGPERGICVTPIVTATKKAAVRFGGFARGVPRPDQVGHDLHCTQIYLQFAQTDPAAAAAWTFEESLTYMRKRGLVKPNDEKRPRREKLPDAVLMDEEGNIEMVIEFGGRYDAKRVEKLHVWCEALSYPYQLW
jgi:hypothetical protein